MMYAISALSFVILSTMLTKMQKHYLMHFNYYYQNLRTPVPYRIIRKKVTCSSRKGVFISAYQLPCLMDPQVKTVQKGLLRTIYGLSI